MPKTISVGLEENPINEDELEEILVELEKRIRSVLEDKLRRRLDELEIIISGELRRGGRELDIVVDVKATGRVVAPFSYDEVIAEAIDGAVKWLEERLRMRGARGGSEGVSQHTQ
ncbi:hypothetical protein PYJP_18290 [Pyrofollis japonicus]|uniref:hypothetical protein n=1 Tax=Pyrofollis japonicus TaxID=3060460 RepID=UPI00295B4DD3|nr:hypothetical protein [Pyrofollis japonicus]BEP18477.1 hypothetical protein PYJP_18290 [Pyrofollis japonicus]